MNKQNGQVLSLTLFGLFNADRSGDAVRLERNSNGHDLSACEAPDSVKKKETAFFTLSGWRYTAMATG
jgi:hypothetical protein